MKIVQRRLTYNYVISSRFSRNSEANASEILENLKEMSYRYWYKLVRHEQTKYNIVITSNGLQMVN